MKKFLYIILASFFSLTITSCAEKEESTTTDTTTTTSSDDSVTLSAPSGLTATGGASQVTLDWTAVSGASSYTVYWDNATGVSSSSTAITSVSTDNYTHSSLDNGTTYYYKVATVNSAGTGSLSSEVNATTSYTTASLTIGSQTYSNPFQSADVRCIDTDLTDNSTGDNIYYLDTIVYYDNKTLGQTAHFYKDSSCTNKYLETSVLTNEEGTFPIPFPYNKIGDNITVVQLSNYYDNGTAISVFDNSSNAVDNGSMYGLICNRDNSTSPFKMCMQIYPKSDSEVHFGGGGNFLSCSENSNDACTSPDNFTHIQLPSGSSSLTLKKYNVMK